MAVRRTDGRDDALADARQDCFLAGTADQLLDVGANRYASLGNELDTVFGHGGNRRRVDDLRVYGHLHSLEDVASRQVDSRSHLEGKVDVCFRGGDQRVDDLLDVSARQVVRLQFVAGEGLQARLVRLDHRLGNHVGGHLTDTHQEQLQERDVHARDFGRNPQEEWHIIEKYRQQKDDGSQQDEWEHWNGCHFHGI